MDCNEFRELFAEDQEIADREHLIECSRCRTAVGPDALQQRIKAAGIGAGRLQIRNEFSDALTSRLKSEFFAEEPRQVRKPFRILIPVFSMLILVAGLGFYGLQSSDVLPKDGMISNALTEIGHIVASNHVYCTLEKAGFWHTLAETDYPEKAEYEQAFLGPLRTGYSESVSLVSVHMCAFDGVPFKHVVLQDGNTLVSVFIYETEKNIPLVENPIVTKFEKGFQMASFAGNRGTVFVVSSLPELKNLTIARTLSLTMNEISYLTAF